METHIKTHPSFSHSIGIRRISLLFVAMGFGCLTFFLSTTQAQASEGGREKAAFNDFAANGFAAANISIPKLTSKPKVEIGYRNFSSAWHDNKGKIWIFGGYGEDANGRTGLMNDLWMWDGSTWIMLAGSRYIGQAGVYTGQTGKPSTRTPGA